MIWIKNMVKRGEENKAKHMGGTNSHPQQSGFTRCGKLPSAAEKRRWQGVVPKAVRMYDEERQRSQRRFLSRAPYCLGQWAHMACASTFGTCICCTADVCIASRSTKGQAARPTGKAGQHFERQHGRLPVARWRRGDAAPAGHVLCTTMLAV